MRDLRRLLRPAEYPALIRSKTKFWPAMRRVARNWPTWIARQMMMPFFTLPCWIRTRAGTRIRLDQDRVDDAILRHVYDSGGGLYFPASAPRVGRGDFILDIGAHSGIYAVEVLRRNPDALLIAVEPNPALCRALERNLRVNGMDERAVVVQTALGPENGSTLLEFRPGGSWGYRTRLRQAPDAEARGVTVPMATVTDVLQARTPVLAKCNAEGAEYDVFPQMFAAGIRPAFVILMTHLPGSSTGDLLSLFRTNGYEVIDADQPPRGIRFHCRLQIPSERAAALTVFAGPR